MRMARSMAVAVCGLLIALSVVGCAGPDPRDLQIGHQQQRIDELERENDGLRSQLARAMSERDAALLRANRLADENGSLRDELGRARVTEQTLPEGWHPGPEGTAWVDVGDKILFKQGYADVLPEGRAELQRIVNDINAAFPNKLIAVIGHTDNVWTGIKKHVYQDNLSLSASRGAAVFRELMKLGLSPERMIAAGQGEYAPKVPNTSDANMQVNRRVQILAVPMPTSGHAAAVAAPSGALAPAAPTQPGGAAVIEK